MIDFILEKFNEFSSDGISSTLLAVILICIVLGFLKGFVKLVFFIFTIIGVGVAAYWGCESGLGFIRGFWSEVPDVSGNVIGALCGLVAFVILRKIFGFLADPVERSGFVAKFAFGIPAAIVSTALAIGLVWFSVNLLRERGTQDEMKYWISQNSDSPIKKLPVLAKLKAKFEESAIGQKISGLYHFKGDEQHSLAKLLVLASDSKDKLKLLKDDPNIRRILGNKKVRKLLKDTPEIQQGILQNNPSLILENKGLLELLKDDEFREDLRSVSYKLIELNQ